ncbi:glycosyltransferase family protein [Amorphus sp. MBR-141]
MKALFYVQHLLGTGHVVRAVAIARALLERGVEVTLVTGNTLPATLETSGLAIEELPPMRAADARFSRYVTADGREVDDAFRNDRANRLTRLVAETAPDLFLTETFPLGRRQFAFELFPTLEVAGSLPRPPLIAASVRDILVRKQEIAKERWMAEVARTFYDVLLVHSDPAFVRLEDSFPFTADVAEMIRYTGYVYAPSDHIPPEGEGDGEVIVSCGGGPVGYRLLNVALEARAHARRATGPWRILVSPEHGADRLAELKARAGPGTIVEAARRDFPGLLNRAAVSISQAGYNTVLDVISAGCPAVLVPFAEEGETEQMQRAQILAERGMAELVPEDAVTPERLAAAADRALDLESPDVSLRTDGAAASAEILIDEMTRRKGI